MSLTPAVLKTFNPGAAGRRDGERARRHPLPGLLSTERVKSPLIYPVFGSIFLGFLQVITVIAGCKHFTREIKNGGANGRGTRTSKIKGKIIKIYIAPLPHSCEV